MNSQEIRWQCGDITLNLARPRIMGIVNVTPDSFSGDGKRAEKDAIDYAFAQLEQGADIIDVGGESTRPGFTAVTKDEEGKRILGVVKALIEAGACVSVDTRHAAVARLAAELGAHILNDVSGFTDPAMVEVAREFKCGLIVMHAGEASGASTRKSVSLDTDPRSAARSNLPSDSRTYPLPEAAPLMRRIMGFLGDQARMLQREGIAHNRIALDPGAGFGKSVDEDVIIQRAIPQLVSMGFPVVEAVSRKSFLGTLTSVASPKDRDAATIGAILAAATAGARILRVHNVEAAKQALTAYWALTQPDERRGFISLGSNIGDKLDYLRQATRMINDLPLTCVVATSHAYESDPALGLTEPVANSVAEIKTQLTPDVLLNHLLAIEKELGRTRPKDGTKGARTIDLDLMLLEGETSTNEHLQLPHPAIGERDFVILPMEDLMADPVRYLRNNAIAVQERDKRYGIVREDLGAIDWQ